MREEEFHLMNIIYTKSFDNTVKKLKKHTIVANNLKELTEKIIIHNSFNEIEQNPVMTTIYKFHQLKHQNSEFYAFNLEKNGGVIRLIVMPTTIETEIVFVYISYNHYKDFTPDKLRFYDE